MKNQWQYDHLDSLLFFATDLITPLKTEKISNIICRKIVRTLYMFQSKTRNISQSYTKKEKPLSSFCSSTSIFTLKRHKLFRTYLLTKPCGSIYFNLTFTYLLFHVPCILNTHLIRCHDKEDGLNYTGLVNTKI